MTDEERMDKFCEDCAPLNLYEVDSDGPPLYVLSLWEPGFKQDAFEEYRRRHGEPLTGSGGNGYDWEAVFQAAFAGEPDLRKIEFDSEIGCFYCYSTDLDVLEPLARRFYERCQGPGFTEFVCRALNEHEDMLYNTVRGFLIRNGGTTMDLETPSGQCHITPEMGKVILKGTVEKLAIGGREVDAEEVLGLRITSRTWGQKGSLHCTMETEPLSETAFTMTM